MSSSFILDAGTVVKVGCLSTTLYPILRQGLTPEQQAAAITLGDATTPNVMPTTTPTEIEIGELMAYYHACTQFIEATSQLHVAHTEVMAQFVDALQQQRGSKPQIAALEAIGVEAGLPVVLEVVLQEACSMRADPRFATDDNAELSWKQWRSGYLMPSHGGVIPAHWIKQFYFPRLLDFRDLNSPNNPRSVEQTTDAALMVGGLMQAWHKDLPGELLMAFRRQYKRVNFSQTSPFNETALERFFNLSAMLDPATRLLNQMTLWQDIMALARKQSIPLAA